MKLPTYINQISILIIILAFSTCYQPKKGCLDINAKNFDVAADESCCDAVSCCCEYPDLKLNVNFPLFPDTNLVFKMGQPYALDEVHFFSVDSIAFFLSDIYLVNQAGDRFAVTDSLLVLHENDTSFIKNNLTLIQRNQFEYNLGKFPYVDEFVGMECQIGLIDEANFIRQDTLPTTHPLNNQSDHMYIDLEHGFHFFKTVFHRDTLPSSSAISIFHDELIKLSFSFPKPLNFRRGEDVSVNFNIYLLHLFENVDFGTDSDALIREKIKQNLPNLIVVD